ncbi:MAG: hypothetical protein KZQ85_10190 [Candidatus Thiodiazotropha sp. (ex Myrtea sp. 'scaly one' KF741663)]|nr:hypothetical protein [Candidatus Thiodiazotropha sp. (ex Myrtea sp. 'scaly one' KF741663)]
MNISEGLEPFIKKAVIKSKRERYLGFIVSKKGQIKFARSLDHDFEKVLDDSKFINKIERNELEQLGDLYCSNGVTNDSPSSMYNLYGKAPWEGGWLLVNKAGTLAIYRPEGRIDNEICIKL